MHYLGSPRARLCFSHVCVCSVDLLVLTLCLGLEGLRPGGVKECDWENDLPGKWTLRVRVSLVLEGSKSPQEEESSGAGGGA